MDVSVGDKFLQRLGALGAEVDKGGRKERCAAGGGKGEVTVSVRIMEVGGG